MALTVAAAAAASPAIAMAVPAIFDRVLAEHGHYALEPLVQGQRHAVHFTSRAR